MNDDSHSPIVSATSPLPAMSLNYIPTPNNSHRPERVDQLLEKRMLEFMLSRRQKRWLEKGE